MELFFAGMSLIGSNLVYGDWQMDGLSERNHFFPYLSVPVAGFNRETWEYSHSPHHKPPIGKTLTWTDKPGMLRGP